MSSPFFRNMDGERGRTVEFVSSSEDDLGYILVRDQLFGKELCSNIFPLWKVMEEANFKAARMVSIIRRTSDASYVEICRFMRMVRNQ